MLGAENVVLIDLRRMNNIIGIDKKNMYAVVEPYVICSQLQAEAIKKGLNFHIIKAGCGTSPLPNAISLMGYGCSGLTSGYSACNLMGVEWVTPGSEVMRVGSPGQGDGWFSGDGPGPSLRGVIRGYVGACGGVGVFTRCCIKLFPWPGPEQPSISGLMNDVIAEVPETHCMFICAFLDLRGWADAAYEIADSEIVYILCENYIGALNAAMMPRVLKEATRYDVMKSMLNVFRFQSHFLICAKTKREYEYQRMLLERIIDEYEGIAIDLSKLPALHATFWWGFVRAAFPPLILKMGDSFRTSYGALEGWDHPAYQSQEAARLKVEFIDKSKLIDDLADNSWGGIYEGNTGFGHQEEPYLYDPRNPQQMKAMEEFLARTPVDTATKNLGPGLGYAGGAIVAEIFGPLIGNHHTWLREMKKTFDPDNVSDPCFFVSQDSEKLVQYEMERRPEMVNTLLEGLREHLQDGGSKLLEDFEKGSD
ncbi:MAG: FAD-binding protein [Actinomycetota bacterium]|nr:FAD-binding protein [Actinomycetota bacterium]